MGIFNCFGLPQIVNSFADNLAGGLILPGNGPLALAAAAVLTFVFVAGWVLKKLKARNCMRLLSWCNVDDEDETGETDEGSILFTLPPID